MRVITTAIYLILTCCGMVVQAQGAVRRLPPLNRFRIRSLIRRSPALKAMKVGMEIICRM